MIVVVIPGAIEVVEAGAGPGTEETGTPLDIATGYEVTIVCTGQFVTSGGQSVTMIPPDGALEVVEAGAGPVTGELGTDVVVSGLIAGTEEIGTPLDTVTGYVVTTVCTGQFVTSGGQSVTVRVLVVYEVDAVTGTVVTGYVVTTVCTGQLVTSGGHSDTIVSPDELVTAGSVTDVLVTEEIDADEVVADEMVTDVVVTDEFEADEIEVDENVTDEIVTVEVGANEVPLVVGYGCREVMVTTLVAVVVVLTETEELEDTKPLVPEAVGPGIFVEFEIPVLGGIDEDPVPTGTVKVVFATGAMDEDPVPTGVIDVVFQIPVLVGYGGRDEDPVPTGTVEVVFATGEMDEDPVPIGVVEVVFQIPVLVGYGGIDEDPVPTKVVEVEFDEGTDEDPVPVGKVEVVFPIPVLEIDDEAVPVGAVGSGVLVVFKELVLLESGVDDDEAVPVGPGVLVVVKELVLLESDVDDDEAVPMGAVGPGVLVEFQMPMSGYGGRENVAEAVATEARATKNCLVNMMEVITKEN
ncbi:MAG: hypothetical protein Q9206_002739 [Seirophora lacunosa]